MEGRLSRMLRLVNLAFAAERVGNKNMADRLFAEAEQIGQAGLARAPHDEEPNAHDGYRQRKRMSDSR